MNGLSLFQNCAFDRAMNAVAAGQTTQNSTGFSMEGFETVTFAAAFGTLSAGAVTSIKLQQSDDDGSADDYTDIAGSAVVVADTQSNKIAISEEIRPRKKWVRCVVVRGTANAVIDGVTCIRSHARKAPVTQGSTIVATSKTITSAAEGTA